MRLRFHSSAPQAVCIQLRVGNKPVSRTGSSQYQGKQAFLAHYKSAIHIQRLSGHEPGGVRSQEHNRSRHVFRCCNAP